MCNPFSSKSHHKTARILYIHHGGLKGGAAISLLFLLQSVAGKGYECIVCSSTAEDQVTGFFNKHGFKTYKAPMANFQHTTGGAYDLKSVRGWINLGRWVLNYKQSRNNMDKLLRQVKPAIVHFNSLVLAPYSPVALRHGIPSVVHVRESVVDGFVGFRKRWLASILNTKTSHVISICEHNSVKLGLSNTNSTIVYNSIDFQRFNYAISKNVARKSLGVPLDAKVSLFAGGSVPGIKGLEEYLAAMAIVKIKRSDSLFLMPSFIIPPEMGSHYWNLKRRIGRIGGMYNKSLRLNALLCAEGINRNIINSEFVDNIEQWIAASDVVCAPHIKPHFSRTVLEAGAMKVETIERNRGREAAAVGEFVRKLSSASAKSLVGAG